MHSEYKPLVIEMDNETLTVEMDDAGSLYLRNVVHVEGRAAYPSCSLSIPERNAEQLIAWLWRWRFGSTAPQGEGS